ncbi:hypothetical protein [Bifidobacterium aerophilum]|uniref:hypothetical protein n=1 Tax=Bifidobacterium aerophilum TaxID=1798155 RepID=UPI001EF86423|nr:hypothetical protein [Bifidobacterium aerophilum]
MLSDELSDNVLRQAKTDALQNRAKALVPADDTRSDAENNLVTANDFLNAFRNDITHCSQTIAIHAGYLSQRGISQLDDVIMQAINRGVTVTVTVRQSDTATETSRARTQRNITRLQALGCHVHTVESCNEFTVFDNALIWFGTAEPLGNIKPDDCSLRFHDPALARRFKETQNNTDS